jgi:seryl-tRNA synthetase
MLSIEWIRTNKDKFDELLVKRGIQPMSEEILKLDEEKRRFTTLTQQLQHAKKQKTELIANTKSKPDEWLAEIKRDIGHIDEKLEELKDKLSNNSKLHEILESLPNLPADDVPYGVGEDMNKLIRTWGDISGKKSAKHHFELGESLGMMDFVQTAKISGSRFVTLKSDLARLERALVNFMIDIHVQSGFLELSPPALVRPIAMYNVGLLPKFVDDSFVTTNSYRLIPTGEVPLVNMVSDSILSRDELPTRYVAHTKCFRSEAGTAGRDVRGMIRMHEFSKVELVTITTPDESENEHEYMLNAAEEILRRLDLPYRVMLLCSGEMGFQSKKTYDIEVWLPGPREYREISSCSNCGDFQARRMRARYKEFGATETTFAHTLNGSALPIGRTIIAIMENYQNEDGSITIPDALVTYMNGIDKIDSLI